MRGGGLLAAAAALRAAAAAVWNGAGVPKGEISGVPWPPEVERYDHGIWRLRVRPKPETYGVTDVVVPESLPVTEPGGWGAAGQSTDSNTALKWDVAESDFVVSKTEVQASFTGKEARMPIDFRVAAESLVDIAGGKAEATLTFANAERLYGIPERAIDMALEEKEYRLMNLDVFEYKLDDTGGIYGTKPFMMAHSHAPAGQPQAEGGTVGMLWLNSADTKVTLSRNLTHPMFDAPLRMERGWQTKWSSAAGMFDVFFFPGPRPRDVLRQYSYVTGKMAMHPLFSLGYHQCRWNYRNEEDTLAVADGFHKHNMPCDVVWLDIEHTNGKRYFTWDEHNFPDPESMIRQIAAKGRKVVTITDPHIKRAEGYFVHDEATANGYYVKTESGSDFTGDCWPGESSWLDFYNEKVRDWYAGIFDYSRYNGSTPDLYTWIDMNEPSVFKGHEVTMDKDAVHTRADGFKAKHLELHNMYGFYQTMATYKGLHLRSTKPPHTTTTRPFILSRSFFSGSQRYAAVWTGDNLADWGHLEKSIPMLLTMSLSGLPFVGADVGGFFKDPDEELLVRWYQIGAYYPFFRGHAHLETKRREPWLFGPERTEQIRTAIITRYQLMPYIYTRFFRAHVMGESVIQPLFFEWPHDGRCVDIDRQMLLGDAVMVKPVTAAGQTNVTMYLPGGVDGERWYHLFSGARYAAGEEVTLDAPIDALPALLRGGSIVPKRERVRLSTAGQYLDPYTLVVAIDANGRAAGELYIDDTHSFAYQKGAYALRKFSFSGKKLSSSAASIASPYATEMGAGAEVFTTRTTVERVVVYGLTAPPQQVQMTQAPTAHTPEFDGATRGAVTALWDAAAKVLTLRKPGVWAAADWTIDLAPGGGEL